MLLAFLHSRFARFVTHPVVGPVLFVGSLYALYFSPVFGQLMDSHWGHAAMQLHFIAVGTLSSTCSSASTRHRGRSQPLVRFGLLLVTIPFHAFFAIAVMSSNTVIAESYWRTLDRPFRTDLLADQYLGGGISWAMGEIPLVLVLGALFVQWIRVRPPRGAAARPGRRPRRRRRRSRPTTPTCATSPSTDDGETPEGIPPPRRWSCVRTGPGRPRWPR